ncbi:hypothetical protein P7K49_039294 [Saguinus oedipus]|uniref:Uncharacterized protein n=1 Tax=Saguinus oedipus TaxID=9490 RepID=A0ABQ9TH37_SAGOE|nr:hypothetical protein P7K49_039294 [Saguinus oedipus]
MSSQDFPSPKKNHSKLYVAFQTKMRLQATEPSTVTPSSSVTTETFFPAIPASSAFSPPALYVYAFVPLLT